MSALVGPEIGSPGRGLDRADVRAFLASALARPRSGPLAVVMPAPAGMALDLLDRLRRGSSFHLHDDRRSITALGATRLSRLSGTARFVDAQRAYESARDQMRSLVHERAHEGGVIWTLGFAFAAGRARDSWSAFGDGLITLPRWCHRVDAGAGTLTLVVDRDEPTSAQLALAELDAIWDVLDSTSIRKAVAGRVRARHLGEERWARSLADVQERIRSGAAAKVVVARRSTVIAESELDATEVARQLERPGATVFCVRRGGASFVGATPERLFRKRGRHVLTEAIAGTVSLERDPSGQRLFASTKDLHEHQLVVDGISSALSGIRGDVSVGARGLRTIGAIAHLATPIDAHLAHEVSAFEILDALHPTPAVGGVPRAAAVRWISENEHDRGWYAGPLGWIDADGNAEVHVALRSALLVGSSAYVYAGCGVVDGSDAHAEYVETSLKLAPMLAALGVAP